MCACEKLTNCSTCSYCQKCVFDQSLSSCCTTSSWSQIAEHVIIDLQEEALEADVRSSIVSHMVMVHQSVRTFSARFQEQLRRSNYVTPKNYLDFIHNYKHALSDNHTIFSGMAARLDGGLQKLIQVRPCLLICIMHTHTLKFTLPIHQQHFSLDITAALNWLPHAACLVTSLPAA